MRNFKNQSWRDFLILSLALLLLSQLTACGLPVDSEGGVPADCQSGCGSTSEFYVGVKIPVDDSLNKPRYAAYNTNWGNDPYDFVAADECIADPTGTNAERDIFCVIHADELDLSSLGVTLLVNAPADKCEYLAFRGASYFNAKPGSVSSTIDLCKVDKTIVGITIDGVLKAGVTTAACRAGMPAAAQVDLPVTANSEVIVTPEAELQCAYDYATRFPDSGAPNCCAGKSMVKTLTWTAGDPAAVPAIPDSLDESDYAENPWGGKVENCVEGPGVRGSSKKDSGIPIFTVEHITQDNLSYEFAIDRKRSDIISRYSFEMGNYISATDQRDPTTYNTKMLNLFEYGGQADAAIAAPASSNDFLLDPFYTVECLDRDDEIQARIRVMIRDWNKKSELTSFLAGTVVDPDQYDDFTDAGNNEDAPFDDAPINDHWDLDDFASAYGATGLWSALASLYQTDATADFYPHIFYSASSSALSMSARSLFPNIFETRMRSESISKAQSDYWSPLINRRTGSRFRTQKLRSFVPTKWHGNHPGK